MKKKLLAGLAVGTMFFCMSWVASATSFTDETDWQAAAGTFAVESFDTLTTGSDVSQLTALGISFDPLNDGTYPTIQPYSSTGGLLRSNPNNLLNDRDFSLPGRGPLGFRPIDPNDFIYGLGMWNVGEDDQLRLSFYDSTNQLIEQVTSASGIGFFGIINSSGAKWAVVDFVGGNGYAPIDDLQTATRDTFDPGTVPEPANMFLLGTGLAGLIGARRKKKQ